MKNWQILQKLIEKWEADSEFEEDKNREASETFDQCARELSEILSKIKD